MNPHKSLPLVLVLLALVTIPATSAARAPSAASDDSPQVTELRSFSVAGQIVSLSPNGRFLAVYDHEADTLCSYDTIDPANSHACADLNAAGVQSIYIEDATWSPDSSRLAFNEPGPVYFIDSDIWVFDADSGQLTDLTDDGVDRGLNLLADEADQEPFFMDILPTWSPDGSEIAFARSGWRDGIWHGTHLMRVSADGNGQPTSIVQVTPDVPMVVYFGAAWAPDGETLYYTVAQPQTDSPDNGIWAAELSTGQTRHLAITADPELGVPTIQAVSPLGDQLLVFYPAAAASNLPTGSAYALLDPESGDISPLVILSADSSEFALPGSATFSPDGQWLLYSVRGSITTPQLFLRRVASDQETVLLVSIAEKPMPAYNLSWGADGTVLVQESPRSGQFLTVEGANELPALPSATPVNEPVEPATPDTAGAGPIDPSVVEMGTPLVVNDAVVTLRSAPSLDAPVAGQVERGAALTALGPSVSAGGYTWIPVTVDATGTIGYIRAELVSSPNS